MSKKKTKSTSTMPNDNGDGLIYSNIKFINKIEIITTEDSQSICLPEECYFEVAEVYLYCDGDKVILSHKPVNWEYFFKRAPQVSEDFMETREDHSPKKIK